MKLELTRKTGFRTSDKFVRIYDDQNDLFYFKDSKPGKQLWFNLPRGTYYTNNTLKEYRPRQYKLPQLPPRERDGEIPKDIAVVHTLNPNKASVFRDKKLILLDFSIRNLSKPQRVHIKLHEIGHYLYATESYCDIFAAREMLKRGYNPSQIHLSIKGILSDAPLSKIRKNNVTNVCENSFK